MTTIASVWEQYLAKKGHLPSGRTRKYYWKGLQEHFGHLKPEQITEEVCRSYASKRLKRVNKATIWAELNSLRSALNWGVKKKLVEAGSYDIWLTSPNPPKELRLTREQAKALIDAAFHFHVKLLIITMLTTAARVTAVLELTWDRVDFEKGIVDLRNPDYINEGRKGRAVVPMNDTLREWLLKAKERARTNYVIEWGGQRIQEADRGFKRAAMEAGIPWCSPHVLRHTAATWMAEAGVPISEIAQYLGHSDSRITERVYAKYRPTYLRNAASSLEI